MKRQWRRPAVIAVLACAALIGLIHFAAWLEACIFAGEIDYANQALSLMNEYNGDESDVVYYDGLPYRLKDNVSTVLVMGIDDLGSASNSGSYNNPGQADFLMLAIFDDKNETYTLLHLNRDTMTAVSELGLNGTAAGTKVEQLALAHTYGSGLEDSCKNTVSAVSNLLYGIEIKHYLSMTMDAVAIANDKVGGVTLTVSDDFESCPELKAGETVTLSGEMALTYVRERVGVADESNLSRMERQRQYVSAMVLKFRQQYDTDPFLVLDTYDEAAADVVTDLTADEITQLAENLSEYEYAGLLVPDGSAETGEEFMEFYPDENALRALVIDLFYQPATKKS